MKKIIGHVAYNFSRLLCLGFLSIMFVVLSPIFLLEYLSKWHE